MRIAPNQLERVLKENLAPVYFVSGDEPLQLGEAADKIRKFAGRAGYTTREVFDVETGFNWNQFQYACDSISLFEDKRILDLRLFSAKPGNEGAKVLVSYVRNPPDDSILLVTAGKVLVSAQKSKWFQALDKHGVIVQVWPLEGKQLREWLKQRMARRGLSTDERGLSHLASRVEGNLLAAAQEIEKIYILHGAGNIEGETLFGLVADSARFDVFKLMDTVLRGDALRASRILFSLKQEGIAPPIVLWGLMKETRLLVQMSFKKDQGQSLSQILQEQKVWAKRKPLVSRALERLSTDELKRILIQGAQSDRIMKGIEKGDSWKALLTVCMGLCGLNMGNQSRLSVDGL